MADAHDFAQVQIIRIYDNVRKVAYVSLTNALEKTYNNLHLYVDISSGNFVKRMISFIVEKETYCYKYLLFGFIWFKVGWNGINLDSFFKKYLWI